MKIGELTTIALLTLVLVNQRRIIWPGIQQDFRFLQSFSQSSEVGAAKAALWRIALTAALPSYVLFILVTTLCSAVTLGEGR